MCKLQHGFIVPAPTFLAALPGLNRKLQRLVDRLERALDRARIGLLASVGIMASVTVPSGTAACSPEGTR